MPKSKSIGIGAGITIIALIIVYVYAQTSLEESNNSISNTDIAESAIEWNYYDLLKNIDDFEGKIIHFKGTVNIASKNAVFGINVGESSIQEDVIFIEYSKVQFVKRDVVEGFGYVKGIRNIERTNAVGGSDILEQVPNLEAIQVYCTSC